MKMLSVVAAILLLPTVSAAQSTARHPSEPKWNAWLGCWELVLEDARESATRKPAARRPLSQSRDARPQVCVQPASTGATFSTRVAGQSAIEQTIVADATDRPITDADCRGTQRAEFSRDGRRLFSRADLACSDDKGNRRVSGFAILGANGTWTDIQAVDISGQQTVRVRSYRRVDEVAQLGPGLSHASPLTLDDLKEASSRVSPAALEAALVETGSTFDLSGKDLIALQDAGVSERVTDLVIALSYPERFVVERRARDDRAPSAAMIDDPFLLGWAFGYPAWSDVYGFYSPLYGRYSPYFYSPFAYEYLRWYDPRYFGGSFVVIGDGIGGGGGSDQPRASGSGRVVDGLGYTRVRPREAETTQNPPSASITPPSAGGGSSSSGGGSVSTQGFSSGSSGSSGGSSSGDGGGRTAQPR